MIAFLIRDLNVCGGTHKQLLKLLDYFESKHINFIVVTQILDLDSTYPEFTRYKDRITVFSPSEEEVKSNRIKEVLVTLRDILKLRKIIHNADVVNIHDNGWEKYFPAFFMKYSVWQVNDLPGYYCVGASSNINVEPYFIGLQQRTKRNCWFIDEITVNVTKNAERVKQCLGREAHVFYCGVEPVQANHTVEESFNRFRNNKIHLLSSGVFFHYRNYETQIQVVKKLIKRGYDVHLSIIGMPIDIEYYQKISGLINDSNLSDVITLEGQVSREKFSELHSDADIFMFLNIDQSWGLAVFEAMSCGLPVIVSNSVGATEILSDKINSIFVSPTNVNQIVNEIETLINNEDYYYQISIAASEFHRTCTWENSYCDKMFQLICK